jgi:Fic family protein
VTFRPRFAITNTITASLTLVERARGFLDAARLSENWIAAMQNRALIAEAHASTHIEGTQLTREQAERLWTGEAVPEADPDDARELLNYRAAFDLVSDYLGSGAPITEGLIREIHSRLVTGVRGDAAAPGTYRMVQNYVVNSVTGETIYTPPDALDVPPLMRDLVEWLNAEEDVHPVIAAGIAQFQLVHVHPFLDGNGRTARLLSTLALYRHGYDFKRLFTISEYYDRDRPSYYRALQAVRETDLDLTPWIEYFTAGLATQLREVQSLGEIAIRRDALALHHRLNERQRLALGHALEYGSITLQEYQSMIPEGARRTLQRDLGGLVDAGLLVAEGATSNLVYRLTV